MKYLIGYYQSLVTMNNATIKTAYTSSCICVYILVKDIPRIETANWEDCLQFKLLNDRQIILQRGCSNLHVHLQSMRVSVFLGVGFSQPMMLAHFERTAYTAVLFSKYTKLWPLSLLVHQTYAILISLLPTVIRLSSPSPVLGEESLPRLKASCLCFWQNHGLYARRSICFIPFVRQYLPETGRDYAGKITRWRVTQPWNPGFESCSATCCLCAVMHMWVINKCHVPGTMPGGWVSEKNKAWHYRSKGLHRQCHVVEIRKEGLKITYSFFFLSFPSCSHFPFLLFLCLTHTCCLRKNLRQ